METIVTASLRSGRMETQTLETTKEHRQQGQGLIGDLISSSSWMVISLLRESWALIKSRNRVLRCDTFQVL